MIKLKKSSFIELYIKNNGNITATCKELQITRQTAYIYLKDKEVKAEIEKKQQEIIEETLFQMESNFTIAIRELMKIIENEKTNQNVKINAINSLFNNWNKIYNDREIMQKIQSLEDRITKAETSEKQDTLENLINEITLQNQSKSNTLEG